MPPADRLDHLNRDQLVIAAAEVPVVLEQHSHPIGQSGLADLLDGMVALLARDGRRCDATAVHGRRVQCKSTPAAADLEHMIIGTQVELAADLLELCQRRLRQCHPGPLEQGTGVHHHRVEHQPEELVAEVVVGRNVTATTAAGVAER
jgi:hypothetical protein